MVVMVILMVLLGIAFPRLSKHLVFAPILGICLGGFAWAVACIGWHVPVTLSTFGGFLFVGVLAAELLVMKL